MVKCFMKYRSDVGFVVPEPVGEIEPDRLKRIAKLIPNGFADLPEDLVARWQWLHQRVKNDKAAHEDLKVVTNRYLETPLP